MGPKVRYRSYMLAVLTAVYAFNFADRNLLNLLMEPIRVDLRLTDSQMGLVSGIAFALFYSTLGIPIARMADRGNRINIIAITTGLWSIMLLCCGFAANFMQLLLARVGVAVGEAGCVPPAQSLITDYYSRSERPMAMSSYMMAMPLSVIIGSALAGWINEWYGWRAAFLTVGIMGVFLALLARFTLREPRVAARLAEASPVPASEQTGYFQTFATLWRQRTYRHLVIGFTLIYLFSYGISQWGAAFLIRTHHIGTGELGSWYAVIWGVGGALGTFLGGYLSARFALDNERLQLKAMAWIMVAFVPIYLQIYMSNNLYVSLSLMMVGAIIYSALFGPLFATIQGVVAPDMRAMAVAVILLFSNLIGMGLGPLAVGLLSDLLRPAFEAESLRIAILIWIPGFLWAGFHLSTASRDVQTELFAARILEDEREAFAGA